MFDQVLPGNTKKVLGRLEKNPLFASACLGGGTGLALQLGHRISEDLDFFTRRDFDERLLPPKLGRIAGFHLDSISPQTIVGRFDNVRFSLFFYDYPLLAEPRSFGRIRILDAADIAAMKISAIASRGVKRDFIDLYFLCRETMSLSDALGAYGRKFQNLAATAVHVLKSLVYFDDAEADPMPRLLKPAKWESVKLFFRKEVPALAKHLMPGSPSASGIVPPLHQQWSLISSLDSASPIPLARRQSAQAPSASPRAKRAVPRRR